MRHASYSTLVALGWVGLGLIDLFGVGLPPGSRAYCARCHLQIAPSLATMLIMCQLNSPVAPNHAVSAIRGAPRPSALGFGYHGRHERT